MKEGDDLASQRTLVADYDSDETVVDDSIPGSEEEDDFYLRRILINEDVSSTSAVTLCPKSKNVGELSPEIHLISKLFPPACTENMETAPRQVSDTSSQEEASQSILRNWERNSESRVPPLRDSCPCQSPVDYTGLCEDSQQLFDSSELQEDTSADKSSLLSALITRGVSCPKEEVLLFDKIEREDVQKKDHDVSKTSTNGRADIASEEAQSKSFTDEIESIDELLNVSSESDSMMQLTDIIDDLSFLEMPEDGSSDLNAIVLAAIYTMEKPQVQCVGDGQTVEGNNPDSQVNTECNNDHTQMPDMVFPDENCIYTGKQNGLYKETLLEIFVAQESTTSTPSQLNSAGCFAGVSSNVEEQSVTQKSLQDSNKKSIVTKDDCISVSWNDASYSEDSNSATAAMRSERISPTNICVMNKQPPSATNQQQVLESTSRECFPLIRPNNLNFKISKQLMEKSKSAKSKETQDNHLSKNTRCQITKRKKGVLERMCNVCDSRKLFRRAKSSSELMASRSSTVSHPRRKTNNGQPQDKHDKFFKKQKSTENTKTPEIVSRKSAKPKILQNTGSSSEREKGGSRNDGSEESSNRNSPVLVESLQLNRTKPVQHCTSTTAFRNLHKRNFMGETLLHKACKRGDLEQVNALIEAGINVNQKDNAGWTAIHEASYKGNAEITLALIQAGADINCKGLDGILPLHDAVYCNHFKVAEVLLEFGANPYETDNNMKNSFDKCCSDKMAEILKSHCGPKDTQTENVTADKKELQCQTKPNLASDTDVCRTGDTCSVEILDTLHDIESKQKKLLSTEPDAAEDAEKCVEELNEIQNVLHNIVKQQKMERDGLAKKYRASADSFKQGILRDKIAKLVPNQKTLPQVVRNQKEATPKVIAHQQSRRSDAKNGETSSILHPCDPSPGRHQISAVNEWLEAKTANGSTMTTKIPAVDSVPDSESNQFPRTISRHISSSEISRTVEIPAVSMISERTTPHNSNLTSKRKPEGAEDGPLSFDSCSSVMNDHLASIAPGSKSHNAFPVSITLEMIEKNNISVENISPQTAAERHQTSDQQLQRPSYEKAVQQADDGCPVLTDVSVYRRLQLSAKGPRSYTSNQNVHQNDVSIPASEKQQKCVETEKKTRKFPLRKLMKLGTLKPGVDVLSFQLQNYSHKATLLCDGQVTDCSGVVFRDPVQWLKALLGNNISVTWKYVADKVTYTGKKLSSFIAQEDYAKTERDPDPEGNITATPSHQPPGHTVLQVNEILLVDKSEFFPSHIMDKYWEEFMTCDNHDI